MKFMFILALGGFAVGVCGEEAIPAPVAAVSNDIQRLERRWSDERASAQERAKALEVRVSKLETTVGDQFGAPSPLDSLTQQLRDLERRMDRVERDMDRLDSALSRLDRR